MRTHEVFAARPGGGMPVQNEGQMRGGQRGIQQIVPRLEIAKVRLRERRQLRSKDLSRSGNAAVEVSFAGVDGNGRRHA